MFDVGVIQGATYITSSNIDTQTLVSTVLNTGNIFSEVLLDLIVNSSVLRAKAI